jgi:hypothetical protein
MNIRKVKTTVAATAVVLLVAVFATGLSGATMDLSTAVSVPVLHPVFNLAPADEAFSLAVAARPEAGPPEQTKAAPAAMAKNWRRTFLEVGAFLAYSTIRYWVAYSAFIEDWQYELTCEDQYRRFLTLEAIRFDSNCFNINWTHSLAGALYYLIARANSLNWPESFLVAFGGSLYYEYIGEWREVISINDMIMTSVGGLSIGEPWHQLASYFNHQRSPLLKALGFINPFLKVNAWLDRKNPASKVYVNPGWHAFEVSAGWRRAAAAGGTPRDTAYIAIETRIVHVPEYGHPGVFRRTLRDTSVSELSMNAALGRRPPGELDLRPGLDDEADFSTRIVSLAAYRQNIDALSRGYAFSIGLGSAFTYLRKRPVYYDSRDYQVHMSPAPVPPTDFRDKMAVVHIAGPVVDWTRFARTFTLRAVAEAYLDFAMMNAWAFNAYSRLYPIEGLKTTLTYYGYYYGFGTTVSGRLDFAWRGFELRGMLSWHIWDSVEGLDRFQNELVNDGNVVDTRSRFLFKAGWRLSALPLRLFAAFEGISRWGKIGDVKASGRETRTFAGLSFLF